jgi:hypothetical protein
MAGEFRCGPRDAATRDRRPTSGLVQERPGEADKEVTKPPKGGAAMIALIALALVMLIWVLTWDGAGERSG